MSNKYRKLPVIIEAVKLEDSRTSIIQCVEFIFHIGMETSELGILNTLDNVRMHGGITIETLEGDMLAQFGDYIIKGVNGEYYPCKPEIFEKTYEKVGKDNE